MKTLPARPHEAWTAMAGPKGRAVRHAFLGGLPEGTSCTHPQKQSDGRYELALQNFSVGQNRFHGSFSVTPEQELRIGSINAFSRNQGILRKVLTRLVNGCQLMGIETLSLTATQVGAYLWSKAGFVPLPAIWNSDLKQEIWNRFDLVQDMVSPKTAMNVLAALNSTDPQAHWQLADLQDPVIGQKLGQYLCLDTDPNGDVAWEGILYLKNEKQRTRLQTFLNPAGPTP